MHKSAQHAGLAEVIFIRKVCQVSLVQFITERAHQAFQEKLLSSTYSHCWPSQHLKLLGGKRAAS